MTNKIIAYQTEYEITIKMIEKLKTININTQKLEKELSRINENLKERLTNIDNVMNSELAEKIHNEHLLKVKSLQVIIKNYDIYFQVDNFCNFINNEIERSTLSNQIEVHLKTAEDYLAETKTTQILDYQDVEHLINKLYDTVYTLIKEEMQRESHYNQKIASYLLEYVKKSNIDSNQIDTRIKKELNELNINDYSNLKSQIYKLDSQGLNNNYVDRYLVYALINAQNTENIKKERIEKLKQTKEKYTSNKKLIDSYRTNGETTELANKFNSSKHTIQYYKRKIATTIISWTLLASTLISLGVYGIPKLSKTKKYSTTTTTYVNSIDDKMETIPEYKSKIKNGKEVTLIEYSPYEDWVNARKIRYINMYDLSHLKIDNIDEYFKIDLEKYDISKFYGDEETKYNVTEEDLYTEPQRKLIIETQDLNDFEEKINIPLLIILEIIDIMILLTTIILSNAAKKKKLSYFSIFDIKFCLEELKTMQNDLPTIEKEYNKLKTELTILLKNDNELKENFNNAYLNIIQQHGKNQELEAMYNEINELKIEESIELPIDIFKPKKKEKVKR